MSACTSSDGTGDTTTTSTSQPPAPPGTTTAPTTAPSDTTTSAPSSAGGDECLLGTWTLDSNAFVENFDEIMTQAGIPDTEVTALDGSFIVEMSADGTYSAVRDGWGFRMVMADQTIVIEINGEETGTWATEGSTLIIDPLESDLTVTPSMELNGEVVPLPAGAIPVTAPPGIASGSDFDCSGDVLTLTNTGVVSVLSRN